MLHRLVLPGEQFDLDPKPDGALSGTVAQGDMANSVDCCARDAVTFSDHGDLVFRLSFTDGSEAIVVTIVPEPRGLVALLGVGLLGLDNPRRRYAMRREPFKAATL